MPPIPSPRLPPQPGHAARPAEVRRLNPEREWEGLMAAAQAGDAKAYDRFLRAILPLVRGVCRRRLRDPSDAEDAAQDTLLTVHRLRHTYDATRPIRPWLIAIADRRAIDRARALGRRGTEVELGDDVAAPASHAAEDALRAQDLRAAVAALPASQRTALRLAKLEELSLAEASARSGMSIGALKVATHRAVASLRRRLGAAG
ncbi:sigma-70 family RNA polymerase sigma factor [Roseomonas sp. CCTCC AB2023176]|uniref:sigma-70 family RNA polymerase sigma factor n=1 Tax=Roseomonas sp. CCTCC AB2023176 TaxID=3342640 RepID=UPI0035E17D42